MALSKDQIPPLWMWLGGALFGVAAHFLNVIKDMKQDNQSGIKGLPQRVGTKASVVIAIVLRRILRIKICRSRVLVCVEK
jgi:4-hydroxybenzoate polyprenyltransferase